MNCWSTTQPPFSAKLSASTRTGAADTPHRPGSISNRAISVFFILINVFLGDTSLLEIFHSGKRDTSLLEIFHSGKRSVRKPNLRRGPFTDLSGGWIRHVGLRVRSRRNYSRVSKTTVRFAMSTST